MWWKFGQTDTGKSQVTKNKYEKELIELKEFADIGDRFKFFGIEMMVVGHYRGFHSRYVIRSSRIDAIYKDKNNNIVEVSFEHDDLPLLRKENSR